MKTKTTTQAASWNSTKTENLILVSASFFIVVAFLVISAFLFDFTGTADSAFGSRFSNNVQSSSVLRQADAGHSIMWRYTNEGWKNIAPLMPQEDPRPNMIEPVHPFVWSGVIAFGALGLMVWSSDEKTIERLFQFK